MFVAADTRNNTTISIHGPLLPRFQTVISSKLSRSANTNERNSPEHLEYEMYDSAYIGGGEDEPRLKCLRYDLKLPTPSDFSMASWR